MNFEILQRLQYSKITNISSESKNLPRNNFPLYSNTNYNACPISDTHTPYTYICKYLSLKESIKGNE